MGVQTQVMGIIQKRADAKYHKVYIYQLLANGVLYKICLKRGL